MTDSQPMIRVMCVDDNTILAAAVCQLIDAQPDCRCVGRLHTADELVQKAGELQPDVVLLDLNMPGKDAFEAMAELARRMPQARTIVLSSFVDAALLDQAVENGAWGYVSKHTDSHVVINAIRTVMIGQFFLAPDVSHRLHGMAANQRGDETSTPGRTSSLMQAVAEASPRRKQIRVGDSASTTEID